ncbi:hypothetical protein M413DRAFT_440089 [Hebeloma cylindrosporum]|uniref:Uncharacterized protein n=1 Tax=Hebeloma cylindrosporum TaxID=76867 RepID=A0A0C3CW34_HEBCY|nr:hypothetical protein M413DRAFT_440089 [Hebeloma cylindrosporum h7]
MTAVKELFSEVELLSCTRGLHGDCQSAENLDPGQKQKMVWTHNAQEAIVSWRKIETNSRRFPRVAVLVYFNKQCRS